MNDDRNSGIFMDDEASGNVEMTPPEVVASVEGGAQQVAPPAAVEDAGSALRQESSQETHAQVTDSPPARENGTAEVESGGDDVNGCADGEEGRTYTAAEAHALAEAQLKQDQEVLDQIKDRLDKAEKELQEKKNKIEEIHNSRRHHERLVKSAWLLVGDGSPARWHDLIEKLVDEQVKAEKVERLEKDLDGTRKNLESVKRWLEEAKQNNKCLREENKAFKQKVDQKTSSLSRAKKLVQKARETLRTYGTAETRLIGAFVPQSLASKTWFSSFLEELRAGINSDPISDPAILVLASLAEFAVMERNPATACFDWKKQLSDIGLVVANYMHHKRSAEGEVVKMLRNFAEALRESDTVSRLKLALKVPDLGPDFNIEEVKHSKNGASVAKVINWCIIDANGVYSKAIVE